MKELVLVFGMGLVAGVGCGDDENVAADPNALVGSVAEDFPIADGTRAVVLWSVVVGSDHNYVWGSGEVNDDRFSVQLEGEPPEGARNWDPDDGPPLADATAMGHVLAFPRDATPPEGEVQADDTFLGGVRGFAFSHAVRWFPRAMTDQRGIEHAAGFECGRCVYAEEGEGFDWYEPVPCDEVELYGLPDGWVEDDPRYPTLCEWT